MENRVNKRMSNSDTAAPLLNGELKPVVESSDQIQDDEIPNNDNQSTEAEENSNTKQQQPMLNVKMDLLTVSGAVEHRKTLNNNIPDSDQVYQETTTPEVEQEDKPHTIADHLHIFTTPSLVVFLFNCILWNMGGSVASVLAYSFIEKDYKEIAASLAMTMFGVGSLLGSISVALLSICCIPNKFFLHLGSNFIMGISALLLPMLSFNVTAMTVCMTIWGFGYGFICANLGGVIEHLDGSKLLYLVYSYEMAVAGIASFIGPVSGAAIEKLFGIGTQFYFSSACILAAVGLFLVGLFLIYALINRSLVKPFAKPTPHSNHDPIHDISI